MISTNFNSFIEIVAQYSKCYESFELFQKNRTNTFIPEHGDQKTGVIGESFIFEYLLRKDKDSLSFGNASEKAWDIVYKQEGRNIKIQVKTVSDYSKTRIISPIHYGWDYLYAISLNKRLLPSGLWIIDSKSIDNWPKDIDGKYKKLCGLKMPINNGKNISNKYFKNTENIYDDFIYCFDEIKNILTTAST